MPRHRRTWSPDAGAHTISRFIDRRFCLVDDIDRRVLLDAIEQANDRWDWVWLSYAAMSTHLHYGHLAGKVDPDRFFRSAHTRFAQRYHRRETRETLGPVFADRPKIYPVRAAALPRLVAYHHRNPVEAGVVQRPSHSRWTSHRAYLRVDPAPPWLDVERALDILGFRDTAAGRRRFDEFVMEVDLAERPQESVHKPEISVGGGVADVDWTRLIALARELTGLPAHEPLGSRSHRAAKTRLLVALVATRDLGQTYSTAAAKLGMKAGSVFNLIARNGAKRELERPLAELRRRLAANDETEEERPRFLNEA